jgi:hypothetical protein
MQSGRRRCRHDSAPGRQPECDMSDCPNDQMSHDPQPYRFEDGSIGEECRNCGQTVHEDWEWDE